MPKGDGNYKWWAAGGGDPDAYYIQADTREAVIQAAKDEGLDHPDYDGFTIVEADRSVMAPIGFDATALAAGIMESLTEANDDCFGEDGPEEPWGKDETAVSDLAQAITDAVTAWLVKHPGKTWAFGDERNSEYFPPREVDDVGA